MDNCDGASAIQSSQEINSTLPPRLRAFVFSAAFTRKFWSDLSKSERNRPRLRSACCNQLFLRMVTKKSCVRSCASSIEYPRARTNEKIGRQYVRQSSASASRAFCSSLPKLAAERIRLQRVVTNSRGSPSPCSPGFPFTSEHCGSHSSIQA